MQQEKAKYFFLQLSDQNLYYHKKLQSINTQNDFKAMLKANKQQQQQQKATNLLSGKPNRNE